MLRKVVIFNPSMFNPGGAERLTVEEAKYFQKNGIQVKILTFRFNDIGLHGYDKANVVNIVEKSIISNVLQRGGKITEEGMSLGILWLLKELRKIGPDLVISQYPLACISLWFTARLLRIPYVTHVHSTMFWFTKDSGIRGLKYATIHKKVFNEIRNSVIGHREFISLRPNLSFLDYIKFEFYAILDYLAVRKAVRIFVLSGQMKWEVAKIYGKQAIVLKGAFPSEILTYEPKTNIKAKLDLGNRRIILNVNRLDPRKRVDLAIMAFHRICDKFNDTVLVIGGIGPEEKNLKELVKRLGIKDKVRFVGYIPEEELWDYYSACEVFVHPAWNDFAIAPYEALAFQKKVVWTSEMEVDENLAKNRHIFPADPAVDDFAAAMERALKTKVTENDDVSMYTWEAYFEKILKDIEQCVR